MAKARHSYLFTHEWFELHPKWAAKLGQHTVFLSIGVLLFVVAFFVASFDWANKIPGEMAKVVDINSRTFLDSSESLTPLVIASSPSDQFLDQKTAARAEELPAQF